MGEREREGEEHQCVVASQTPFTGGLAHNPGMCLDWELNQRPFGSQAGTQSTEPHEPPSWIFIDNMWVGTSPFHVSAPAITLDGNGFLTHSCHIAIQIDSWWFWVMGILYIHWNFDVVVWGGKLCLPMLPPWLEVCYTLPKFKKKISCLLFSTTTT